MKKIYSAPTVDLKCYNSITEINSDITLLPSGQTENRYNGIQVIGTYDLNK